MNEAQISAIRCALADLSGALQAHQQGESNIHDWRAHQLSIDELVDAFPELSLEITT
jgi:hypothetical protein